MLPCLEDFPRLNGLAVLKHSLYHHFHESFQAEMEVLRCGIPNWAKRRGNVQNWRVSHYARQIVSGIVKMSVNCLLKFYCFWAQQVMKDFTLRPLQGSRVFVTEIPPSFCTAISRVSFSRLRNNTRIHSCHCGLRVLWANSELAYRLLWSELSCPHLHLSHPASP